VDTWQWRLLHKRPGPPPTTPFNFKADVAASVLRARERLRPQAQAGVVHARLDAGHAARHRAPALHGGHVTPKRERTAQVIFEDSTGKTPVDRGTDEIIHVRSFSVERTG
jgi:hypothetical protein